MRKKKINKKILFSFIIPYILLILLIFTVQYISNSVVLNALKNNAIGIVKNSFKSNINIIEQNLEGMKETAALVANNTVPHLDNVDRNKKDFFSALMSVNKELCSYFVDNVIIKDICIQDDADDYLVNFTTAYSSRAEYYKTMLSSETMDAQDLLRSSENANGFCGQMTCLYPDGIEVIPFVFPTPILQKRTGSVMVYINKKNLFLPIVDLINKSEGALQIVDKNTNTVVMAGSENIVFPKEIDTENVMPVRIDGRKYYAICENGKLSHWSYAILLPESYVLNDVRYYQISYLIVNFFFILLGFVLCMFFTVRKTNSYVELLEALGIKEEKFIVKGGVSRDEYRGLLQHVCTIKDENSRLLEKGQDGVLRKILGGQIEKKEEILKELKNQKMDICAPSYTVIVLQNTERTEGDRRENIASFLSDKILKIFTTAKICFFENGILAILLPCSEESVEQDIVLFIKKIENDVLQKHHIGALLGCGSVVKQLDKLSLSYREAVETVNYNYLMGGQKVYSYADIPKEDNYYYPIEMENELFKYVMEHNYKGAREILYKIHDENFIKRQLSVSAINELLSELRASIKKICSLQTEYLEFSFDTGSVKHFFEYAIVFIYHICTDTVTDNETTSRGHKICKEIKCFVQLHYRNSNLSLEMIAGEFRIHPNYLSTLFKKHTGTNLASYIEGIRVEKAAELLSSGKYTVKEVAVSVGFSNDATFRRRFKKIKGVSPSNYIKYE